MLFILAGFAALRIAAIGRFPDDTAVTAADPGSPLTLHPDRLFPADPTVRGIARRLYTEVEHLPLICPHGHVDARVLLDDRPFPDPTSLLIASDHYVTRLLHASGVALDQLGVGLQSLAEDRARAAWRLLCEHWSVYRGTPVRYWLEVQLASVFGISLRPSPRTADAIYDQIAACLREDAFRPRELYRRFGVEVLATTDDPCDDLSAHAALAADPSWHGRVIPTFRPDRYLEPGLPGWRDAIARLASASGLDTGDYAGYLAALEQRRQHFIEHGATAADHSHADARTDRLALADAERIYRSARVGTATSAEVVAFRRHMVLEMARMSCDDGLVMTLHPGVVRGHHRPTAARYGPDTGHDIPVGVELTGALRPLLERFGTTPGFHLVVFTLDETLWSRELAPLAGFYPSVYAGAPWWFLDAPDAIRRFRGAIGETAGFSRTAGFVDDTRAFCSIPARHEMARRVDAGVVAQLVAEHRLTEDEALETLVDLVATRPRVAFKLDG